MINQQSKDNTKNNCMSMIDEEPLAGSSNRGSLIRIMIFLNRTILSMVHTLLVEFLQQPNFYYRQIVGNAIFHLTEQGHRYFL